VLATVNFQSNIGARGWVQVVKNIMIEFSQLSTSMYSFFFVEMPSAKAETRYPLWHQCLLVENVTRIRLAQALFPLN
jgi:hypothetical protein